MANVLGIGGFFYKSNNPEATREWYARVLGFEFSKWGGSKFDVTKLAAKSGAASVWNVVAPASDFFEPSKREFMINLVVDNLEELLGHFSQEGVEVVKLIPDDPFGRFAHIIDPDGIKIELWEPPPKKV